MARGSFERLQLGRKAAVLLSQSLARALLSPLWRLQIRLPARPGQPAVRSLARFRAFLPAADRHPQEPGSSTAGAWSAR